VKEIPMASASSIAPARRPLALTGRNGLVDKYFYFAMSLLSLALVVTGFGRTVDHGLLHAAPPRPALLWFHAAAFSSWVIFYILQSLLVRTRNVKVHRTLGWFGVALGTAMIVLGTATGIVMAQFETHTLHESGANAFLLVPLFDMVAFAVFFSLAVLWRQKPELHRRLMFIATCGLLVAALARIPLIGEHFPAYYAVDMLIFLGVLRDLLVARRIHKAYLVSLPILIACHVFVVHTEINASAWWLKIAGWLVG
jgi:hypothetical protein